MSMFKVLERDGKTYIYNAITSKLECVITNVKKGEVVSGSPLQQIVPKKENDRCKKLVKRTEVVNKAEVFQEVKAANEDSDPESTGCIEKGDFLKLYNLKPASRSSPAERLTVDCSQRLLQGCPLSSKYARGCFLHDYAIDDKVASREVTRYEKFCRQKHSMRAVVSEDDRDYPVVFKNLKKYKCSHSYSFSKRQRMAKIFRWKIGLSENSTQLYNKCKECQVVLQRLNRSEIKRWTSPKTNVTPSVGPSTVTNGRQSTLPSQHVIPEQCEFYAFQVPTHPPSATVHSVPNCRNGYVHTEPYGKPSSNGHVNYSTKLPNAKVKDVFYIIKNNHCDVNNKGSPTYIPHPSTGHPRHHVPPRQSAERTVGINGMPPPAEVDDDDCVVVFHKSSTGLRYIAT